MYHRGGRHQAQFTLAHQMQDKAVATACGWTDYTELMTDDKVLGHLAKGVTIYKGQ